MGRVCVPSPGRPWPQRGTGSEHGFVWHSQTFSFKGGMAELCCSAKNVFKGYWRWRGEAGFPIKGKAVYRGVCVAPLKSLPQAFSACFRNSNGCGNLCAVRGTREVTTQM